MCTRPCLVAVLVLGLMLGHMVTAVAQTTPTAVRMVVYQPGTQTIVQTLPDLPFVGSIIACNQTPQATAPGVAVNPKRFQFDDPLLAGRACIMTFPDGPSSLPDGTYEAAMFGVAPGGEISPEASNRVTLMVSAGGVTVTIIRGFIVLPH